MDLGGLILLLAAMYLSRRGGLRLFIIKVRSIILLVVRAIWMERNMRVFKEKSRSHARVLDNTVLEAEAWKDMGYL
jgi:hypothetical protein